MKVQPQPSATTTTTSIDMIHVVAESLLAPTCTTTTATATTTYKTTLVASSSTNGTQQQQQQQSSSSSPSPTFVVKMSGTNTCCNNDALLSSSSSSSSSSSYSSSCTNENKTGNEPTHQQQTDSISIDSIIDHHNGDDDDDDDDQNDDATQNHFSNNEHVMKVQTAPAVATISTEDSGNPSQSLQQDLHVDRNNNNNNNNNNDSHFYNYYRIGRRYYQECQFEKAFHTYRMALQCKYITICSESEQIRDDFCTILYFIGKLHLESVSYVGGGSTCSGSSHDGIVHGIEALHVCLNVRRSCFGSKHISVAYLMMKIAAIHIEYFDQQQYQYALDLLLEALSIILLHQSASLSPSSSEQKQYTADLIQVWNAIGRIQHALGQEEEAQSSFEEVAKQFITHTFTVNSCITINIEISN